MGAKAYVGITGAATASEAKSICSEFSDAGYSMQSRHIPMLGFLASYKTLNGQKTQNRRYPLIETLPELMRATDGRVFTMVHYNSREMYNLSDQVAQLFENLNTLCSAIQLNIIWPDIMQVGKIKEKFPGMHIVFQASHTAMAGKTA
ncbi:hypothetical protein KY316_03730, partial [Candidatus Woesearchaeota archaeon]|nr:hypothetical protein [Candidatus Woesearchaeota archaeon]